MSAPSLAHRDDSFGLNTGVQSGLLLAGRGDRLARHRGHDELAPARGFAIACLVGTAIWVGIFGIVAATLQLF